MRERVPPSVTLRPSAPPNNRQSRLSINRGSGATLLLLTLCSACARILHIAQGQIGARRTASTIPVPFWPYYALVPGSPSPKARECGVLGSRISWLAAAKRLRAEVLTPQPPLSCCAPHQHRPHPRQLSWAELACTPGHNQDVQHTAGSNTARCEFAVILCMARRP
jgi:hypothetical protein